MKKLLMSFILCMTSILSFAAGGDKIIDFYVDTETGSLMSSEHGVDVEHADGTVANYTISIENLEFSEFHCQCVIKIEANGNHPWDELFIYRLRYIDATDADDIVDVEQHAQEDPVWSAYEVYSTHVWFKDTFLKSWVYGYDLCYEVHDTTNDHHLYIVIHNAFGHNIITGVEDVKQDTKVMYYDLNGHSSNMPFNGINIVKRGHKMTKEIY